MAILKFFGTIISNLNIWVSYAKSLFFIFLQVKPNYEHDEEKDSTRGVIISGIAASGT